MSYYRKRKQSGGKTAALVIVLLALILGVVYAIIGGVTGQYNPLKWAKHGNDIVANADSLTLPDQNTEVQADESDGILLSARAMTFKAARAYTIAENADNVKEVTATIMPENATYKVVDFTIAWNGEQAGKPDISQYITIAQPSDGALKCAITVLQPFAYEAVLTCTARPMMAGDWVPSATCLVNYYKRINNISSVRMSKMVTDEEGDNNVGDDIEILNTPLTYVDDCDYSYLNLSYSYGVGSKNIPHTVDDPEFVFTLSLKDQYKSAYSTLMGIDSNTVTSKTYNPGPTNCIIEDDLCMFARNIDTICGITVYNADTATRAKLYQFFYEKYTANEAVFDLRITMSYSNPVINDTFTYTYGLKFNPLAIGIKATGITLDKDEVVF